MTNQAKMIAGYEEERFSRIKSDANFPIQSIKKIFELHPPRKDINNYLYISHWYDDFLFYEKDNIKKERFDRKFIQNLIEEYGFKLRTINEFFTHHDAHAHAAKAFYDFYNKNKDNGIVGIIVADGFGNWQEVISVYEYDSRNNDVTKIAHFNEYQKSLGLMYQYATAFCGMKENQDEYKFLGYESHIKEVLSQEDIEKLLYELELDCDQQYAKLLSPTKLKYKWGRLLVPDCRDDKYIKLDDLQKTRDMWYRYLNFLCVKYACTENFDKKVLVGFVIQTIIENIICRIIKAAGFDKVILSGGIFYNVKLNNAVMNKVKKIGILPPAGDQGAAIGVYYKTEGKDVHPFDFNNFLIGKRDLNCDHLDSEIFKIENNVWYLKNRDELIERVVTKLKNNEIVSVVTGDMEFGPRALCNTSTFALPNEDNVALINTLNGRSTVMPMAPIMTIDNLEYFFEKEQIQKIVGSYHYMIITLDYKKKIIKKELDKYRGIMHKYPLEDKYSGRPQVVFNEHFMYEVLKQLEPEYRALINTSFNVHGRPIVYSAKDAIDDYKYQLKQKKGRLIPTSINLIIADI